MGACRARSGAAFSTQCAIRTLLNAWPTSSRLHLDSQRQCAFGCDAPDSLTEHYWARCPIIRAAFASAWGSRAVAISFADLNWWGLPERIDIVASLFSLYCSGIRSGYLPTLLPRSQPHISDLFVAARALRSSR